MDELRGLVAALGHGQEQAHARALTGLAVEDLDLHVRLGIDLGQPLAGEVGQGGGGDDLGRPVAQVARGPDRGGDGLTARKTAAGGVRVCARRHDRGVLQGRRRRVFFIQVAIVAIGRELQPLGE